MASAFSSNPWWDEHSVALVTGARGIGLEIARQLGEQGLTVIVTSRSEQQGLSALEDLRKSVPRATFHYCQADITKAESIKNCAAWVHEKVGHVEVLINNAGMAFKGSIFGPDEAQQTIDCNLKGTRRFTEAILPMMSKSSSRIVNVCSMAGRLGQLTSPELQDKFKNPSSVDEIEQLADSFVAGIRDGTYRQQGWSQSMYGISKLAEISYTFLLAKQLKQQGIIVNAVCPGWCQTDMSSHSGPKTAAQGADTPVWVALRDSLESGQFYQEREQLKW